MNKRPASQLGSGTKGFPIGNHSPIDFAKHLGLVLTVVGHRLCARRADADASQRLADAKSSGQHQAQQKPERVCQTTRLPMVQQLMNDPVQVFEMPLTTLATGGPW